MTIKELMDRLATYDPSTEVYLYLGDLECFDDIGGVEVKDHSPSSSWFYDEYDDDGCEADDCRKVVTIMPKSL